MCSCTGCSPGGPEQVSWQPTNAHSNLAVRLPPRSLSGWPSTLYSCDWPELLGRPALAVASAGPPRSPLVVSVESFGPRSSCHDSALEKGVYLGLRAFQPHP